MKNNYYSFISQIIIANIDNLDIDSDSKQKLLIDLIKRLENK